jgi:hypothetical protein
MPARRPTARGLVRTALCGLLLLAGCSSDTMILESDVPLPSGMSTIRSGGIRRGGGTVTGGEFIIAGEVANARSSMDGAAERFRAHGWAVSSTTGDSDIATGTFVKDSRTAALTIRRRTIEPRMSTGMLSVTQAKP